MWKIHHECLDDFPSETFFRWDYPRVITCNCHANNHSFLFDHMMHQVLCENQVCQDEASPTNIALYVFETEQHNLTSI